jgi:hypothetical protein
MPFTIKIEPEAKQDIQEGIDWYNEQQLGLGKDFHRTVKRYLNKIKTNPFYQVRYDEVHCLPLKKYPFMIHFTINEDNKQIIVHAVFNTFRDSKIWKERKT